MFLCNKVIIKAWKTVGSLRSLTLSWSVNMYVLMTNTYKAMASSVPAPQGWEHCTSTLSLPSVPQTLPQGTITSRVHEFSWGNLNKLIVTPERLLKTDHPSPAWRSRLTEAAYGLWKRSLPSNCVCVLRAVSWGFLPFLQGVLVSPVLWGSSEVIMPALIPIRQWPCHAQTTAFCNT